MNTEHGTRDRQTYTRAAGRPASSLRPARTSVMADASILTRDSGLSASRSISVKVEVRSPKVRRESLGRSQDVCFPSAKRTRKARSPRVWTRIFRFESEVWPQVLGWLQVNICSSSRRVTRSFSLCPLLAVAYHYTSAVVYSMYTLLPVSFVVSSWLSFWLRFLIVAVCSVCYALLQHSFTHGCLSAGPDLLCPCCGTTRGVCRAEGYGWQRGRGRTSQFMQAQTWNVDGRGNAHD